jgi:hypothetical protein
MIGGGCDGARAVESGERLHFARVSLGSCALLLVDIIIGCLGRRQLAVSARVALRAGSVSPVMQGPAERA